MILAAIIIGGFIIATWLALDDQPCDHARGNLTNALSPQDEQAGAFGDIPFLPAALCFDPFHAGDIARD